MRVLGLTLILLAGCAAQQQAPAILTPEVAQQMSAMDLCRGTLYFRPINAQAARQEASRRGLDCTTLYSAIAAEDAARKSAAAQVIPVYQPQPYQIPMPQPIQFPPETVCTTERFGNQLRTVCRQ